MFGIRYNVTCPRCHTTYETDHGITDYYKIVGRGNDQDYCQESCPNCNLEFYHLGGDEQVHYARYRGLTAAECTAEKLDWIHRYRRTSPHEEAHIRSVVEELYSIPLEDVAIPVMDVKEEDLKWSTTICW